MVKVLIVTNQTLVLLGLTTLLSEKSEAEVVSGTLGDFEAFRGLASDFDIVVLDVAEQASPASIVKRIKQRSPDAKIIAICSVERSGSAVAALEAGSAGIVTHNCRLEEFRNAFYKVLSGDNYIQSDVAIEIFKGLRAKEARRMEMDRLHLTIRETQVVSHLKLGKTNRQIGESLDISEKTVKHYIGVLKEKFDASNRLEVVLHAQKLRL